jgi:hypothetical protein
MPSKWKGEKKQKGPLPNSQVEINLDHLPEVKKKKLGDTLTGKR